jgi:hypothetical protein
MALQSSVNLQSAICNRMLKELRTLLTRPQERLQSALRPSTRQYSWLLDVALPCLLIILGLLPIWAVSYVPLQDYSLHLLEAYVPLRYDDPASAYAEHYDIAEGWYLRSNALTTLGFIGLGSFLPIAVAGKLVLSGYVVLLVVGFAALLRQLGQPRWFLLLAPPLLYNATFLAGMLNWSYGFALLLLALVCYNRWTRSGSVWAFAGLATLTLLIYVSHVLAWGLLLIVICVLAAVDNLSRRWIWLVAALSSAAPMLLMTRPTLAVAPVAIAGVAWLSAVIVRRLRLQPVQIVGLACAAVLTYAVVIYALQPVWKPYAPEVVHSIVVKQASLLRLFALRQYSMPSQLDLSLASTAITVLMLFAAALLALCTLANYRRNGQTAWRWPAVLLVLLGVYAVIPTRTSDIVTTEPRVLLLAWIAALAAARVRQGSGVMDQGSGTLEHHKAAGVQRAHSADLLAARTQSQIAAPIPSVNDGVRIAKGMLIAICVIVAVLSPIATLLHARQYDEDARGWSETLAQLPANQRLLIFSSQGPTFGDSLDPLQPGSYSGHHFMGVYALERGGFVSNAFFNGPLLPRRSATIPPYWSARYDPVAFVRQQCAQLRDDYDYAVVWDTESPALSSALASCNATVLTRGVSLTTWEFR